MLREEWFARRWSGVRALGRGLDLELVSQRLLPYGTAPRIASR